MTLAACEADARGAHLELTGTLHDGGRTILLLSPAGDGFWPAFTASPEFCDGAGDPLDRWSNRVIGALARQWGGQAVFPSDGPPYAPFADWALASGRAWVSPVGLLVHDTAGLWLSFRGAVLLEETLALPPPPGPAPCTTCEARPCLGACPVGAMAGGPYDLGRCRRWLDDPGNDCMARGCAVRRACPAGSSHGRLAAQSAFHMRAFHPG